ncbi:MAG TPA: M67 family metallopeptidase [Candidatus Methanoperedenaceae archaeon]|nr:M67 family metallopeptidase [Candidatus Methanoperedenaceae archaeon]
MLKEIRIPKAVLELVRRELIAHAPLEACGVLIGSEKDGIITVESASPIENIKRSRSSFELDPSRFYELWTEAEKRGKDIVCVYHTHPLTPAMPSQSDRECMQNNPYAWLIAGAGGIRCFIWDNGIRQVDVRES